MKLPDFRLDSRFLRLREEMGAHQLIQVRGSEWRDWVGRGVDIESIEEIEVNPADQTLSYEGRRILVYIRDQWVNRDDTPRGYRYHIAECRTLTDMRNKHRFGRYVGTQRTDGYFMINFMRRQEAGPFLVDQLLALDVCKNCLDTLDWHSYSQSAAAVRNRLVAEFDPAEFLEHYGSLVATLPEHCSGSAPVNGYPDDWAEISNRLRSRRGWVCEDCRIDLSGSDARYWCHVHHIDGDRGNSAESNLKVLCLGCHAQQSGHRSLQSGSDYREFINWRIRRETGR